MRACVTVSNTVFASGTYFGTTTHAARTVSAARATLSAGGATYRVRVPSTSVTSGPNRAPRIRAPMISIERSFNEIGRGSGKIRDVTGWTSANSSEHRRHPWATRAAHSVLLPDSGGAGRSAARPSRAMTAEWTTTR